MQKIASSDINFVGMFSCGMLFCLFCCALLRYAARSCHSAYHVCMFSLLAQFCGCSSVTLFRGHVVAEAGNIVPRVFAPYGAIAQFWNPEGRSHEQDRSGVLALTQNCCKRPHTNNACSEYRGMQSQSAGSACCPRKLN